MTEQLPPVGPTPFYPAYGYQPPRTHAEMTWQDIMAFIFGCFTPLSIVGLLFGLHSYGEAKKVGLKQHALGMVGWIFATLGCAAWTLFIILAMIGQAGQAGR